MENNLQETALEVQQVFKQVADKKLELIARGQATLQSKQDLTERWNARKRVRRDLKTLYEMQSKSFVTLVKSYSAWLNANPEPKPEYPSDLKSKTDEEKIAFLLAIRDERLRMLIFDVPEFEIIVKDLESSIVAIDQTVNRSD
jgi:hypothetical protein